MVPNVGLIEIHKLMDDVIVFMRWQAEGSPLTVTLEPIPAHLPTDILADLRWLREDLMCVAANEIQSRAIYGAYPCSFDHRCE